MYLNLFFWGSSSLWAQTTHVPVLTYHYDNSRQGANTNENLLTLANVNVATFGKLFTYPVDGYVYAQPLIMTNLTIPGRGVRNVVIVVTEHDTVYAFDADSNADANGGLLWKTNLGIAAATPDINYGSRYNATGSTDLIPEEGATGTPVIDAATGTLYLDAFTREVITGHSTNYLHRIHALNVTNGSEQPYSPVIVTATVPGVGVDSVNGVVTFNAIQQLQRPALTLAGGILYVAYGSHADTDWYHGWILGYNPATLQLMTNYVFNTTPNATTDEFGENAGEGAIWMGGNGLCVDEHTNLYFMTGNGSFSQDSGGGDYGDSFVKLSTANHQLAATDFFTPFNQATLADGDGDLGSGGALLLPDLVGSTNHPHLMIGCGKEGKIYLLDRDNLGHFNSSSDSQIVQSLPNAVNGVWSSPAYFNNTIYYQANGDVMKAFLITNGFINPVPISTSLTSFGYPGATPVVSANGTNDAIAWATDSGAYASGGPAVLHAYNATNLAIELYNSSQNLLRDNPGGAVKMTTPTVSGGKVYVGAEYALSVFGPSIFLPAPVILPNGGSFNSSIIITITNQISGAQIYYTLDGSVPTTNATTYSGPFALSASALVQAIAVMPGAVNSSVAAATFYNAGTPGSGTGLLGAYFANHDSINPYVGQPTLTRTDAVINFNWDGTSPDPTIGRANFTVKWTGCVQPQLDGDYTFFVSADDGVRLWVDGQLLIDGWIDEATTDYQGFITLNAHQFYNLELDYFQNGGGADVALSWSDPSGSWSILPQTQLYPFTNLPPTIFLTSPAANSTYTAPASVTLSAEADAPYNSITAVSFFANTNYLGTVTNSPFTLTARAMNAGNYSLTAVATDGSGLTSTSSPLNITIAPGNGLAYGITNYGPVPAFFNMPTTFGPTLPTLLSQTGIFSNTPSMICSNGFISYAPNVAFWSDNAIKTRYFAVPSGGSNITPDHQIGFGANGSWTFPAGSIFVKTFELNTDESNPAIKRRLETRLLVRDVNGAVYGVTYKWRTNNLDADLLTGSLNENVQITNATGVRTQTWYYPSQADCLSCHTPPAGYVLGVNTRQLNGNYTYPISGVTDNQLRTLNSLGLFNPAFDEAAIANFEKLSALTNLNASVQDRARSYLDANCAQCHQPGGTGITFDGRYDTPLPNQHLTNYAAAFSLGYDHAQIIASQDIWRSMIYQRMNTTNATYKMPPLGRNLIDTNAVALLTSWINSLPGTPAQAPPTITPSGGLLARNATVTLQSADTNASIYFTLSGSLPSTNSYLYSGPINLTSNATLSAIAYRNGFNNSVAASAAFSINNLYLTSAGFLTSRQFQIGLSGIPGSSYVLQATTNLQSWVSIATNSATTNILNLIDSKAMNYPYRFYRVIQQ